MTTAPRTWKRAGLAALGLLASSSCVSAGSIHCRVDMRDLEYTKKNPWKHEGHPIRLEIARCQLDSPYMMNLAKELPRGVKEFCLNLAAVPEQAPTIEQKQTVAEYKDPVEKLEIWHYLGEGEKPRSSPATLAWVKVLFPAVPALQIDVKSLPIQGASSITEAQRKELETKSVTDLTLAECWFNTGDCCPISENLKLFPSAKSLSFVCRPSTSITLEDKQFKNQVFSDVRSLTFGRYTPSSLEFLDRLPLIFPFLEELSIGGEIFEEITTGRHQVVPIHPFRSLKKLDISHGIPDGFQDIVLRKNMGDIFPSLSEIKMAGLPVLEDPSNLESYTQMPLVKRVKINWAKMGHPPKFLDWLFPEMEILEMPNCRLKEISGDGASSLFPHLKELVIPDNSALDCTIVTILPERDSGSLSQAAQLENPQKDEQALHSMGTRQVSSAGRLNFPLLQALDITGSFFQAIPHDFFDGCREIRNLKMSFDPNYGYNTVEWWSFLGPLSKLRSFDLLVRQPIIDSDEETDDEETDDDYEYAALKDEQHFSGDTLGVVLKDLCTTLAKVGGAWPATARPTIRLFILGRSEPIRTVEYLEKELPEQMVS